MKVLIPLLTRQEDDAGFLLRAAENADEVIALLIIDQKEMLGKFGFAGSGIMQGNALIARMRQALKGKNVKEVLEWGDTVMKIIHVCERENADCIVLKKFDSFYWREMLEKVRQGTQRKIEVF